MNTKTTRHGVNRVVAAILVASAAFFSSGANAQDAAIEEIIVTGSRLARDPNLAGALPVQSLNAEEIQKSGELSITDVVNDMPALLTSITPERTAEDAADDGASVLQLRGLGISRTLVLVDGRRHVGGLQGSSSVDVGSIPMPLVERVEVLTGGASAIYGADAVTGVINFILKDDFEGLEVDANYRMSGDKDAEQSSLSIIFGENFADGRGNVTLALDARKDRGLRIRERSNGKTAGSARNWVNPALRFQQGDIGADTPNFARYYNYANTGLFNFGLRIPTAEDFVAAYTEEFDEAPSLSAAETALINRAANAPQNAILPERTFPITSGYGYIIPGNPFTEEGFDPEVDIDLNGNGNPDCLDSFTGYNSAFAEASYGIAGGCWNVSADGSYAPVRDGLIAGDFEGFGGDSNNVYNQDDFYLLDPADSVTVNLTANYALNERMSVFGELKWVTQDTETNISPTTFWDLLFGAADNPYLPDFIQGVADKHGGVAITIDPVAFNSLRSTERDTYRLVVGLEGELANGWTYELSANYGRFDQETSSTEEVIVDRFFAAIDAVTDPATGQPACRVEVNPDAPAQSTPFNIPAYEAGYYSFTPGAGDCVPLNIWAGAGGFTREAVDWVTTSTRDKLKREQTVAAATLLGDTEQWFSLPGGPIGFAVGVEWREEQSTATFDPFRLGVIPPGSPLPAGSLLEDHSENTNLVFRPQVGTKNETGDYHTTDGFLEFSLPLVSDRLLAEQLTLDMAGRWADYSTIGSARSWKTNLLWAPATGIALRGSVSHAVRAPNITELFGPTVGTTFRPMDPCDVEQIHALQADNSTLAANYERNCTAELNAFGLDPYDENGNYVFSDPLSAAFGGTTSGNRDLTEEIADTVTYGLVFEPGFLDGFSLTVDHWDIEIDSAISTVSAQKIVDGCYGGAILNREFCDLFTRNQDSSSAQFGGFNSLRSTTVNFDRIEARGIDFSMAYNFTWDAHTFGIRVQGTKVDEMNSYTNPGDPSEVDPDLGETLRPELAGNIYLDWEYGNLGVSFQSQYMGEMLLQFTEIETARTLFGDAVFMDETWLHDISVRYTIEDELTLYGGIRNLTEEEPFITSIAIPASIRGRMFFLGATYRLSKLQD